MKTLLSLIENILGRFDGHMQELLQGVLTAFVANHSGSKL